MSNESDTTSTATPTARPGPDLLAERTLSGIFVHLFGVVTWFLLPGVVYLISDHEFTRANARNAVNWQAFHALVLVGVYAAFGAFALADWALPGGVARDVGVGLIYTLGAGVYALGLVFVLNVAFSLVATAKAIFGTAWTYPIAPDVVGWIRSRNGGGTLWVPIGAYALAAPVVFAQVLWLVLGNDVAFWPFFVLLVASAVGSPLVAAALYRDARDLRTTDVPWRPNWIPYLGLPFGVGALAYLTRTFLLPSENPSGDAVYAFMFALWVASVVYLYRRHDRVGTP